jgi:hypothetical protein
MKGLGFFWALHGLRDPHLLPDQRVRDQCAALIVFGLMYAGILPQPDWSSLSEHFNHLVARIKAQASGLEAFIEGNLHSTGAAAAGLFTGFKKN